MKQNTYLRAPGVVVEREWCGGYMWRFHLCAGTAGSKRCVAFFV